MPHRAALAFGRGLGRLARLILWKKTDRCEARCVTALGVGITSARKIIKESFSNMGMSIIEFIRFPNMKKNLDRYMSFDEDSKKILREAISRGRGVILMTSHMANWELAAMRSISDGFPLDVIYTPQRNQGGANEIIFNIRTQVIGMKLISNKGGDLKKIFRALKAGETLVIMQDLDARSEGVATNFLGIPASTRDGVVKLYQKFHCPVVPAQFVRDSKHPERHKIILKEIISDRTDSNGRPFGEDLKASLDLCNEVIEGWIKNYPGQWLWMMDRWESTFRKK